MSFASSVTFDLSLEDLIQGLVDSSWVLVEGWEGGDSGRVKSQLPSLGLGHIWGTTYIPSSLWKQAVSSLSTTCIISDSDWFHPFTCPASPETSLVSLGEFFFFFLTALGLHCGESNGTPLQYSCLENPMNREAWKAAVHRSLRVGHDWATSLSLFTFIDWKKKWPPTPLFLPRECQRSQSLEGWCLWGHKE